MLPESGHGDVTLQKKSIRGKPTRRTQESRNLGACRRVLLLRPPLTSASTVTALPNIAGVNLVMGCSKVFFFIVLTPALAY